MTSTAPNPFTALRTEIKGILEAERPTESARSPYLVLDHSYTGPGLVARGTDGFGERYLLCSPAGLDDLTDLLWLRLIAGLDGMEPLSLPVYRRDLMPEGWPRKWVRT